MLKEETGKCDLLLVCTPLFHCRRDATPGAALSLRGTTRPAALPRSRRGGLRAARGRTRRTRKVYRGATHRRPGAPLPVSALPGGLWRTSNPVFLKPSSNASVQKSRATLLVHVCAHPARRVCSQRGCGGRRVATLRVLLGGR